MAAVASATPSTMPTVTMEAPRVVTMNIGSRLWISSDEMSMNSEANPNAQMPVGRARHGAGVALADRGLFEGGESMCDGDRAGHDPHRRQVPRAGPRH